MSIILLTKNAAEHIQSLLSKKGENYFFRLWIKKTGCSGYMYMPEIVDSKKPNDIEIKINNLIIYVDPDCISKIAGTEIDYVKRGLGVSQLEFKNPNAESLCGCGESFNLKGESKL